MIQTSLTAWEVLDVEGGHTSFDAWKEGLLIFSFEFSASEEVCSYLYAIACIAIACCGL